MSGSACDGWKPVRPNAKDVEIISDELVSDILSHNRHGEQVCGWRP